MSRQACVRYHNLVILSRADALFIAPFYNIRIYKEKTCIFSRINYFSPYIFSEKELLFCLQRLQMSVQYLPDFTLTLLSYGGKEDGL
jgi:hypothetical protein